MAERLVVRFEHARRPWAEPPMVYIHWGGETRAEATATLEAFLASVLELDTPRLDEPLFLAAKLVVWAAQQSALGDWHAEPLNFGSVGIVGEDKWGDAVAVIDCTNGDGTFTITRALRDGHHLPPDPGGYE